MRKEDINTPVSAEDLELMRQDLPLAFCVGMELVYRGHKSLGEKGKLQDRPNQYKEMALRADVQAEDAFLYRLRLWAVENDVTVYTRGEESGEKTLSREQVSKDKRLLVLDGLDGSANYLQRTDWGYGTMAAIASTEDPTYDDFETVAIMMPEEGWTILAQDGKGVYIIALETGEITKLRMFGNENYDDTKILSDNYFEEAKKLLGKKQETLRSYGYSILKP